MLIVADENMPYVADACQNLGCVKLLPGRSMTAEAVRDADILLVRSVTQVNAALLEGSRVRFVGSATIGTDHVDLEYLREAGVAFSAAPGCNANSVSEYITAALLLLAQRHKWTLAGMSIGIVGVGNVGNRVAEKTAALGMRTVLNDPPLQRATGDPKYRPLDDVLSCDIVTLHAPLERGGADPTYHMVDKEFLASMKPKAVVLNSSRGAVVDNTALLAALESRHLADAALDVWEGEPNLDLRLLERVGIGTPHIAGYSMDGKANGTNAVYRAACNCFNVTPEWNPCDALPAPEVAEISLAPGEMNDEDLLRKAILTVYPIERDDAALRAIAAEPGDRRAAYFDGLRKTYPIRREFPATHIRIECQRGPSAEKLTTTLRGLGFPVVV